MWSTLAILLALVFTAISRAQDTDEIQDADPAQSGYLDNHNLDPLIVGSPSFGILWQNKYGEKERWYAKPLVYTPLGAPQLVFTASSMNIIRTIDAVNGTLLNSRTVQPPFLKSDIGCTDIPDFIGITGTPIIDRTTNTVYFFSKGYKDGAANGGVANGIYKFYAVDVQTLQDRPGFPILIDGHYADNDHSRYFVGGTVLQRPSLAIVNSKFIVGGFGGHCDLFNYTGMLITISTSPGVGITSLYAMEASPGASPTVPDIFVQKGGKAGIWHAGMGFAVDGNQIFLVTGNGQGHANGDVPASGRTPLSTLDEVVASFSVSESGKLTLVDYFEPYNYIGLDAGDRDLGSSGVTLLDPKVFKAGSVARIAITVGKNGKVYVMNANNLGGFKQNPDGTDNVIQVIDPPGGSGSIFAGTGSYPLEGGFVYFTPVGQPTYCYKFGVDRNGAPTFIYVSRTSTSGAGRVGIGTPTITSYKGQPGTGILWITDPNAGLQAFKAVPSSSGNLTQITLPATGGLNKFLRPAFGDGRLYVSDNNGNIICLGSPVSLPLSCPSPVDYGPLPIGSASIQTVNCTTLIPILSIDGCVTSSDTWQCSNTTFPKGSLPKGAKFSFPVVWNLTQASIRDAQNASFGKVNPGSMGGSLNVYTKNGVPKYSNFLPISLIGTTVSSLAFFSVSSNAIDFGSVVVGSDTAKRGLSKAIEVSNVGSQPLKITGIAWTKNIDAEDSAEYINVTSPSLGSVFSSTNLPVVGSFLAPGESTSVSLDYHPAKVGSFSSLVQCWTTGGSELLILTGTATTAPVANISVSTTIGGWNFSESLVMDFGNVVSNSTQIGYIQLCNSGGSNLLITKSKPPIDIELFAPDSATDLHEGQRIEPNSCAIGKIVINPASKEVNRLDHSVSGIWILNTDDLNFGVHDVHITANIVTRQVGPLLSNGSAEYLYLGCYNDGHGRLLQKQFSFPTNENGQCQTTCFNAGYRFSGTEYRTECWCGNNPPSVSKFLQDSGKPCSTGCPGDGSQSCGGPNTSIAIYYDRNRYTPNSEAIPIESEPPHSSLISSSETSISASLTTYSSTDPLSSTFTGTAQTSRPFTGTTATSSSSSSIPNTQTSSVTPKPMVPGNMKRIGEYSYVGCYTEATKGRALGGKSYASDMMTIESCYSFCQGFVWFGLEYRRECYCGNSPNFGSIPDREVTCSLTCKNDTLQTCGGFSRLSMYSNLPKPAFISPDSITIVTFSSPSSSFDRISPAALKSSSTSSIPDTARSFNLPSLTFSLHPSIATSSRSFVSTNSGTYFPSIPRPNNQQLSGSTTSTRTTTMTVMLVGAATTLSTIEGV